MDKLNDELIKLLQEEQEKNEIVVRNFFDIQRQFWDICTLSNEIGYKIGKLKVNSDINYYCIQILKIKDSLTDILKKLD